MTSEEREKISEMLLERMVKNAGTISDVFEENFIDQCKTFIATKTDDDLLYLLLKGNSFVFSPTERTR